MKKIKNKKNGFSLLEVIVAIFIITVGLGGAISLLAFVISASAVGKSQIIATNLAQEGIEVVRNIRDTNWLEGEAWNDGLGNGDYRVQYNSLGLMAFAGNPVLNIDSQGIYLYDNDEPTTHFHRKITINNISDSEMQVISEVTWSERNRDFNVIVEDRLYDWR